MINRRWLDHGKTSDDFKVSASFFFTGKNGDTMEKVYNASSLNLMNYCYDNRINGRKVTGTHIRYLVNTRDDTIFEISNFGSEDTTPVLPIVKVTDPTCNVLIFVLGGFLGILIFAPILAICSMFYVAFSFFGEVYSMQHSRIRIISPPEYSAIISP